MPSWFWPVLACIGGAFLALGLQRFFLGTADRADGVLVCVYGLLLGYAWRRAVT